MRTAQEIYEEYRIMPLLQLHQIRVAAIGELICNHFSGPVDSRTVILGCLFHDMGNIIKSDLARFPKSCEPEGAAYWQRIKDEWIAKYGPDEHRATLLIAREIGLPEDLCALIDETRFARLEAVRDGTSFESKIIKYADLRAAPLGVLSLHGRLEEARVRYADRPHLGTPESLAKLIAAAEEVERQIFARASIKPEDITDEAIAPFLDELRNYPVA